MLRNLNFLCLLGLICVCLPLASHACPDNGQGAFSCYDVHGRLGVRANLRLYLWPVGTKHLYGIAEDSDNHYDMPGDLAKMIVPDKNIFGDFRVCPVALNDEIPLRTVCIVSASHMKTVKNRP